MKKLIMTAAIVLAMGLSTFAQQSDGMLLRSNSRQTRDITTPSIPTMHGYDQDVPSNAPLGSGIAVLLGLGAAYLVGKKRKEED